MMGWLWQQPAMIYTAAGVWFLLALVPALIVHLCNRRVMQQEYAAVRPTGTDPELAPSY